jgi:MFS family permease
VPPVSGFRAIPRTVWLLGLVSLFTDLSSSIVYGLLPGFLVTQLGATIAMVALIDAIAEATASFGKLFSGMLSDWVGRRKELAFLGYGLSGLAKFLFPVASSAGMVLGARFVDRLGKGVRGAPRDALVADVTPAEVRGTAYGLRQALDEAGTLLGPLIAMGLMWLLLDNIQAVFWIACVPAAVSLAILGFGVREERRPRLPGVVKFPLRMAAMRGLGRRFWLFIAALLILLLPRFTDAFYLLRGQELGLRQAFVPSLLATTALMTTFLTAPVGRLSDSIGRWPLLFAGFLMLAVSHAVLAEAGSIPVVFLGAALFGLHLALTQGLLATLVADMAPADQRGTAFGIFHLVSGIAMLGTLAAGEVWDAWGAPAMFWLAAAVTALGLVALLPFAGRHRHAKLS